MSFWCLQFLPKNEQKQVDLRYHNSKVEFIRSFFGRIHGLTICFRVLLTFSGLATQQRSFLYRAKCLLLVFAIAKTRKWWHKHYLIFCYTYLYIPYLRHYNLEFIFFQFTFQKATYLVNYIFFNSLFRRPLI